MVVGHSLYSACQITAEVAGVPWARAKLIYAALQHEVGLDGEPLLPLSRGRAVKRAEPKHVARFLIALALTDDPRLAPGLVIAFAGLRQAPKIVGAEHLYALRSEMDIPETVEGVIAEGLRKGWPGYEEGLVNGPESGLAAIDFQPDEDPPTVEVTYWGPRVPMLFRFEVERPGEREERHLRRTTRIDGHLFKKLAVSIEWASGGD